MRIWDTHQCGHTCPDRAQEFAYGEGRLRHLRCQGRLVDGQQAHNVGPLTEEYRLSLRRADRQVGRLIKALKSRLTYNKEDWLILTSTDHGHVDEGGHGGPSAIEKNIFVLASGPSVQAAPQDPVYIVDVGATALHHLGISLDSKWNLDGKPLRMMNR